MVASSLMRRMIDGQLDHDLPRRPAQHLSKADLTYERIWKSQEAKRTPRRVFRPVNLTVLINERVRTLCREDYERQHSASPLE
jgi:hypothetical protein